MHLCVRACKGVCDGPNHVWILFQKGMYVGSSTMVCVPCSEVCTHVASALASGMMLKVKVCSDELFCLPKKIYIDTLKRMHNVSPFLPAKVYVITNSIQC